MSKQTIALDNGLFTQWFVYSPWHIRRYICGDSWNLNWSSCSDTEWCVLLAATVFQLHVGRAIQLSRCETENKSCPDDSIAYTARKVFRHIKSFTRILIYVEHILTLNCWIHLLSLGYGESRKNMKHWILSFNIHEQCCYLVIWLYLVVTI